MPPKEIAELFSKKRSIAEKVQLIYLMQGMMLREQVCMAGKFSVIASGIMGLAGNTADITAQMQVTSDKKY